MSKFERAFFTNLEGAALGVLEDIVFPGDIDNSSDGRAAGGKNAEGGAGSVLGDGVMNGRGAPAGAADDVVTDEVAASVDAHVPTYYGDPAREWHALGEGRRFTVMGFDVVTVHGTGRCHWLHSLLGQALTDIAPGALTKALLFSLPGRIENGAFVYNDGDVAWLSCDRGDGRQWVDFPSSAVFTMRVEVNLRKDLLTIEAFIPVGASRRTEAAESSPKGAGSGADRTVSPLAGVGPGTGGADSLSESSSLGLDGVNSGPKGIGLSLGGSVTAALEETVLFVWRDPWPGVSEGGATYTLRGIEHPVRDWRQVIDIAGTGKGGKLLAALECAGMALTGMLARKAVRVAGWRPRVIFEVDEWVLPHELDWLRTAVHLNKGCHHSQKTVIKLVNLGRPPRRLVELFFEGPVDELP